MEIEVHLSTSMSYSYNTMIILLCPGNEAKVQVGENMTCFNVCCHSQKTWELKMVMVIRFTEALELAY